MSRSCNEKYSGRHEVVVMELSVEEQSWELGCDRLVCSIQSFLPFRT